MSEGSRGLICVTVPNFVVSNQTVADKWLVLDFSRWRPGVQCHTHAQMKVKCGVENSAFVGIICRQYACGSKSKKWNTV